MKRLLLGLAFLSSLSFPAQGADHYKQWLDREVRWIISKQERKNFKHLKTTAQRRAFIESFWRRRDPTPRTLRNEYKEEHYQRLRYADAHFNEGIPGWRTDRGHVYIIHGPPVSSSAWQDRIVWYYNSNPYAEFYQGPVRLEFQRGGALFQQRNLSDGPKKSSTTPGRVPDFLKQRPAVSNRYRLVNAGPGRGDQIITNAGETDRYLADMLRSPGEVLEEQAGRRARRQQALERARQQVSSQVTFGTLEIHLGSTVVRQKGNALAIFTTEIPPSQLEFGRSGDQWQAEVDLICSVRSQDDRAIDSLFRTLTLRRRNRDQASPGERMGLSDRFVLPRGTYRLECVAREESTGRVGQALRTVSNLPPEKGRLGLSVPLLSQRMVADPSGELPVHFQGHLLLPPALNRFQAGFPVFLYFEVYNCRDSEDRLRRLFYDYEIYSAGRVEDRSGQRRLQGRPLQEARLSYALALNLSALKSGSYTLLLKVVDARSREYTMARVPFQLVRQAQ